MWVGGGLGEAWLTWGPPPRRAWVEPGAPGREGATHLPLTEPLLGVREVGAGAVSTNVFWPGLTQVLGGLVGAVQLVMLQAVLGPLLSRPPRLDFPAVWGLHRQEGTAALLPRACPLVVEQEAPGGHWTESSW